MSLGVFMIIIKKLKGFKKFGVSGLLYAILTAIVLAVPALFLNFNTGLSEISILVFSQLYIVFLGILHVTLAKNTITWYPEQKLKMQMVFIIGFLLFGFLLTNISFEYLAKPSYELIWYFSLLWFIVPVLLNETIIKLAGMPSKEFKTWQYPIGQNIEDPSDAELDNPIVISFVFMKSTITQETATFRAKAPAGMDLGRLFYFFINDYNGRHPEGPISYSNEKNEADPWVFFKLKNKLFRIKEPLDQDSSISTNNIRENDVLICKRVDKIIN